MDAPSNTDYVLEDVAKLLTEKIESYNPDYDKEFLLKAVDFAIIHHGSQKRHSGDPYYHHPIAVSEILADLELDISTIITALLHDTVEDTEATIEDLENLFGKEIANLVDGVTKLTKIEFQSDSQRQAENFRKFLLAISEDIRVLLVKLADRLHNMRTLHFIKKPEKRKRIAHETMEIYAALAERIGMQKIKDELQDIAFREMNPEGYTSVASRLEYLRESGVEMIGRVEGRLKKIMEESGIDADVSGREKMPYSIWRKMQKKNVTFEQLSDIVAFRVIVDNNENCYQALGVIHAAFHNIPEHFKDFISTPKANGYKSLHTVVMGPEQRRIEIQIRTKEMHKIAEMGVAAHWSYKQDREFSTDGMQYGWLREMLHIVKQSTVPEEFLEHTRLEMYHDQVFCFTPMGDLIALPTGATAVDFAYAVHSEVGRSCVGAKVNSRITPLRTQLHNGDQVEILQSKSQEPSPSWEHFVVTGKARSEIRRHIKTKQHNEYMTLGKEMLINSLKQHNEELRDKMLEPLLEKFHKEKIDDLYVALGEGIITRQDIIKELFPEKIEAKKKASLLSRFRKNKNRQVQDNNSGISTPIMGLIPGMAIHFAGCCHPLPGEKIAGIVNSGKGVTIHTIDCGELENFADMPERWIDISWEKTPDDEVYVGRLRAILSHKKGALGSLANTVAQSEGNINNIRIVNRSDDFFEIILDIEVSDVNHLDSIIALLKSKSSVHDVSRYKEGKSSG